ncbi:MAG: germination protein YpeB, partial [Ruminococcus sp.]|nr:germination protein YpeB [Ruminococcus sp.]
MKENSRQKILIKNNYTRALEDLALAADNINSTLEKQLYSGTPKQQSELADKLFKEASSAKAAMLQLPLQELELENTYKYLSQVGNYSRALAEKTSSGKVLTREEYNNLKVLHEYAKNMCDKIWEIEKSVSEGEISIDEVGKQSENNTPNITEGFSDFEEGFSSYPTLIYDGPFSDHIMQKEPLMTKGAEKVTEKKALQRCTSMLGISSNDISLNDESEGKLPTYIFTDKENSISCAVTKRGGMVSYFIKSRDPEEATLSTKDAVGSAEKFLSEKGYGNMKVTYYERINNICTVNFAYEIDGVTCYTDLIKVSVALDNGEVLGFDASGYIVNHKRREFPEKV